MNAKMSAAEKASERIVIRSNHEIRCLNAADVFYIEKENRHAVFHTIHGKWHCSETLSSLSKKLDNRFFRCHRSFIINIEKIERIVPIADRLYEISFYDYPGVFPIKQTVQS